MTKNAKINLDEIFKRQILKFQFPKLGIWVKSLYTEFLCSLVECSLELIDKNKEIGRTRIQEDIGTRGQAADGVKTF